MDSLEGNSPLGNTDTAVVVGTVGIHTVVDTDCPGNTGAGRSVHTRYCRNSSQRAAPHHRARCS